MSAAVMKDRRSRETKQRDRGMQLCVQWTQHPCIEIMALNGLVSSACQSSWADPYFMGTSLAIWD